MAETQLGGLPCLHCPQCKRQVSKLGPEYITIGRTRHLVCPDCAPQVVSRAAQGSVYRDAARMLRKAARMIDHLASDQFLGSSEETTRRFLSDIHTNIHAATARLPKWEE